MSKPPDLLLRLLRGAPRQRVCTLVHHRLQVHVFRLHRDLLARCGRAQGERAAL
nr:truncated alpha-1,4-galactosyltransferase [Homo sapiens]